MGGQTANRRSIRKRLLLGVAGPITMLVPTTAAVAQSTGASHPSGPQLAIAQTVPKGFEHIDNTIETRFDIIFSGRRLGTANVRIANGKITFLQPDELLQLLPPQIDRDKVRALIAHALPDHEDMRCSAGQTFGCGTLPTGESGFIISPENFTATLILGPDYLVPLAPETAFLGPPVSGPSLVQTANLSVSAGDRYGGSARFGGVFNTLASVGRTSFVGQILARDNGTNLQRAYAQRYWDERRAQAGLLQESQSLSFTNYRLVGADFGSFFGSRLDTMQGPQTPIQIVLPRAAVVEIYRDGVLIKTTRLEAGIQQIDTSSFPAGSYPVRILARDGGQVLLDEVHQFTRVTDLPPPGSWAFDIRGGLRARDYERLQVINGIQTIAGDHQPFFPSLTNQGVIAASISRRVGQATGLGISGLLVGSHVYGEFSGTTYSGSFRAIAAVAAGSDSSYSIIGQSSFDLARLNISLSARHTRVPGKDLLFLDDPDVFRPFLRDEDTLIGSVSAPVLKGQLTLNASYSRTRTFRDQYIYGARYTRTVDVGRFGSAQLSLYGLKASHDVQFGITISFFKRVGRRSLLNIGTGAEYRKRKESGQGGPDGIYPVLNATLSRNDRIGSVDLSSSVGASTDADRDRVFATASATSGLGHVDGVADYERDRGANSGFGFSGNLFSGLVIGGGHIKLGIRDQQGDAIAMVGVSRSKEDRKLIGASNGRYRIMLGNQFVGTVAPGDVTALSLPSFRNYTIGLQPENSPPYSIDLTPKTIPLYPGNVALIDFRASRVVTLFGRLLDTAGRPLTDARVSGAADTTVTDDHGYFIITAGPDEPISFYDRSGAVCRTAAPSQLIMPDDRHMDDYHPIGDVTCSAPDGDASSRQINPKMPAGPSKLATERARQSLNRARTLLGAASPKAQ